MGEGLKRGCFEQESVKEDVLQTLDQVCSESCVLASNTSTIPISTLASYLSEPRRRRFIGTQYFSPVSRMKRVEVIPAFDTAEETTTFAMDMCSNAGKVPIRIKDVAGFVVNRMFHAFMIEAVSAVAEAGERMGTDKMARHLIASLVLSLAVPAQAVAETLIISNVTVIDGNGGPPRSDRHVVIEGERIRGVHAEAPDIRGADVTHIEGGGRYLVPGFIDTNVHASVYGNASRRETAVKYADRNHELVEEFAQRQLKYGVTTVRDSYGSLEPLLQVRDAIERGETIGSRLLVAGNIIGWGGPFSLTFSLMDESGLTLFQEQWNDRIAQGVGEELMDMGPDELRVAMRTYLDKGPDFIKYGGTSHFFYPSLIGFSPRAQKVIVEETHARGLIAETHATSREALHLAVEAGIDFIQHPEILSSAYPQELLDLIIERDVICGLRSNTLTGQPWQAHLQRRAQAQSLQADAPPPATSAERRRRAAAAGDLYQLERENAEALITAGCRITIATDNYQGRAPEFRREPKPEIQEAGIGSLLAIEGLVELGMTPMQALVAGTRNGAIAAGSLSQYGTVETGKIADLVLLEGNPLEDIRNIRRQAAVIARGRLIDTQSLPLKRLFYTGDR